MKVIAIILSVLIVVAVGCATISSGTAQGVAFEGTAKGYRGPITVQVRMDNGSINEITIVESKEDKTVGVAAIEELIDIVIENNNTDVDVISGATITSRGFINAVNDAILKYRQAADRREP